MKHCILFAALCVLAALLLPALALPGPASAGSSPAAPSTPALRSDKAIPEVKESSPAPARKPDSEFTFSFLCNGETREVTMAEYLPGVLSGEMPASFEPEALRAQAIAARTFVLYHMEHTNPSHPDAAVCSDPGCCQVWLSEADREKSWGGSTDTCRERINAAVEDTDGLYLSYNCEPILACFHSSSARYTESCGAIWGTPLPYLTSVTSPESDSDVPNYVTQVEIAPEKLREIIAGAFPEADLSPLPESWLGVRSLDTSGRVSHMEIGGVIVPGTKLRSLFSLRSTNFTVEWTGHSFLFTVTGFGHGAGMSQYGANVMAKNGSGYEDILCHYYQGAVLTSY